MAACLVPLHSDVKLKYSKEELHIKQTYWDATRTKVNTFLPQMSNNSLQQ